MKLRPRGTVAGGSGALRPPDVCCPTCSPPRPGHDPAPASLLPPGPRTRLPGAGPGLAAPPPRLDPRARAADLGGRPLRALPGAVGAGRLVRPGLAAAGDVLVDGRLLRVVLRQAHRLRPDPGLHRPPRHTCVLDRPPRAGLGVPRRGRLEPDQLRTAGHRGLQRGAADAGLPGPAHRSGGVLHLRPRLLDRRPLRALRGHRRSGGRRGPGRGRHHGSPDGPGLVRHDPARGRRAHGGGGRGPPGP